jgi:phage RecT family recombinase
MQQQPQTNNNRPQRGMQGRPEVNAQEKFGEGRIVEILAHKKNEILALFANDLRPDAMYERACALAIGAYRNIQDTANESAAKQNKSPQRIDETSAVACCLWAMQRKLDPGTDVYLVPYGGKVTPIMSPDGVIKLLFRTGLVKAINARYVFHGEEFDYMLGSTQWVKHKKNNIRPMAIKDRGQVAENVAEWNALAYAYVVIDLKDGGQTIEVLDKADIMYFRSLSPTGDSQYGGWAKFPAAFGRKAALKQGAKFVPKDSEVSIILTSEDTERGVEIPDEIMRAVGARMLGEMTGEVGPGVPTPTRGEQSPPETQHSKKPALAPGDPKTIFMPGTPPQPTIWDAPDDMLAKSETYARGQFEGNKWPEKYYEKNAIQLATIRQEMRERNLPVPPQAFFDSGLMMVPPPAPEQEQVQVGAGQVVAGQRQPGED